VPTTAGCPICLHAADSAFVVQRLIDAGAIPLGKTNLDQFATGLNGTRSPYGACRNAFNPDFISGGSSSGSAVAVALGYCSFSLGTDTAGSGRVPAAFNNLIGHKPSLGWLSSSGLVPACRSLDAISVFALTAEDAETVLTVAAAYDPAMPFPATAGRPRLRLRPRRRLPGRHPRATTSSTSSATPRPSACSARRWYAWKALGGNALSSTCNPSWTPPACSTTAPGWPSATRPSATSSTPSPKPPFR
jgi:Asp-tRNA(Asn)/Glu-tRNA(Gln) amidotransferase A subunit family amidase